VSKKHQTTTALDLTLPLPYVDTPDTLPIFLGKDEMNLAEYPFALLTHHRPRESKTFTLTQQIRDTHGKVITQTWSVLGSDKYGLPTPYDDDVLLALLYCYKRQGRPTLVCGRPLHHRMMTHKDLAFFSPPKICQRGVAYPQCHS